MFIISVWLATRYGNTYCHCAHVSQYWWQVPKLVQDGHRCCRACTDVAYNHQDSASVHQLGVRMKGRGSRASGWALWRNSDVGTINNANVPAHHSVINNGRKLTLWWLLYAVEICCVPFLAMWWLLHAVEIFCVPFLAMWWLLHAVEYWHCTHALCI